MIYLQAFFAFLSVGLFSFGGGYAAVPLIQNQIIDKYGWLTIEEFADLITISEMTPGPIVLNCATFVGQQIAGFPGAIICTLGSILPSFIIVLILSFLYVKYRSLDAMHKVLIGLRPAVVALILSAGTSILFLAIFNTSYQYISLSNFRLIESILFILGIILLRKFKLNPIIIIFGSGILGLLLYIIF